MKQQRMFVMGLVFVVGVLSGIFCQEFVSEPVVAAAPVPVVRYQLDFPWVIDQITGDLYYLSNIGPKKHHKYKFGSYWYQRYWYPVEQLDAKGPKRP